MCRDTLTPNYVRLDALAHMMMHDFYCEMFNDAAKDASASSDAEDAFNQTEFF